MKFLPTDRRGKVRLLLLLLVLAFVGVAYRQQSFFLFSRCPVLYNYCRYPPREGDVVFQSLPRNDLADAIEGITHSPYSHCGVVLRNEENEWVVIESIFSVRETPLFLWELRGRGGAFDAYRLDSKYDPLIPKFKNQLLAFLGRPYDYDYDMSKGNALYCSDLVYLSFDKISGEKMGILEKLRDLDWKPYEQFIKSDQGGELPLDRVMITPASLARAPQLKEVYHSGL